MKKFCDIGALIFFLAYSYNLSAADSLKDIHHENFGFNARVPVTWLLTRDEKSVRYSTGMGGGQMDVKHWAKKSALNIVKGLTEKVATTDKDFSKKDYVIGPYRIVSFTYRHTVNNLDITQNVNVVDTPNGAYVVQFSSETSEFNQVVNERVLSTFLILK
jgi:hypothetical protein